MLLNVYAVSLSMKTYLLYQLILSKAENLLSPSVQLKKCQCKFIKTKRFFLPYYNTPDSSLVLIDTLFSLS